MQASDPDNQKHILLLGIDHELFKSCFGRDEAWPCMIKILPENCSEASLADALCKPGLLSVVFQDFDTHYVKVREYYLNGGFVVYFGIYGEFAAPGKLSKDFGIGPWSFSAYTKHEYKLTLPALQKLGNNVTEQQYTKSNLVDAPIKDRLMVPKEPPFDEFVSDYLGYCSDEDDYEDNMKKAPQKYEEYREEMGKQSPLLLHESFNGGAVAYLGFVNGDGDIPVIVRALITRSKIDIR